MILVPLSTNFLESVVNSKIQYLIVLFYVMFFGTSKYCFIPCPGEGSPQILRVSFSNLEGYNSAFGERVSVNSADALDQGNSP